MGSVEQSLAEELVVYPQRWVKGMSGNPLGALVNVRRPNLIHRLYRKLSADADLKRKRRGVSTSPETIADEVINELTRLALFAEDERVRIVAIKEILDRCEGKPQQKIEVLTGEPSQAQLCHNAYRTLTDAVIAEGFEPNRELILAGVEKIYGNAREVAPELFEEEKG